MSVSAALKVMESEIGMSEYIPLSHHVTPHIVSTHSAEYMTTWKISGRAHECADLEDVFLWTRDLNAFVRGIGTEHISFWAHIHRRRVVEYPDSEFSNTFCNKLNDQYKDSFKNYNLMVNDLYLTIVYRESTDKVMSFFAKREKHSLKEKSELQITAINTLNDINRQFATILKKSYGGELLGIYSFNNHAYSSTLEWYSFLINGEFSRVPVCKELISDYLPQNRPLFSKWGEIGEQRHLNKTRKFAILEIKEFDDTTEPGQFNILLESNYEFILTQSFSCLSLHAARGFLKRHKAQLVDANDVAISQIEEIDQALDELVSRKFVMGEHHSSLLIYGKTAEEVRDYAAKAKGALLDSGIVPHAVDLALEAAFWAQLPGNWRFRPRPMPITSLNFLCLNPFHNFLSGKPNNNPWGPAVTILKTVSGTPHYFNFHVSGLEENATDKRLLGHSFIGGQSSAGKTTILGFLLAQAQKFDPTIVAFDKDRGLQVAICAMGGKYLPLKNGEASGFNPLQLEPTKANILFLKRLIMQLIASSGDAITHNDEREIDQALDTVMHHIDKPLRRLSLLLQSLPNPLRDEYDSRPTVHARLEKWCQGGEYGWLFDNEKDELDLTTHRLFGFDVTDFLDNQVTRTPTIMYLLFRTEDMIDGRRFMYVFDEFWKILNDAQLEYFVKDKLKTMRKENGICLFSTQEPDDALRSNIGKTIAQQLATLIFLENPRADADDYIEGFKLTQSEFAVIKEIPSGSRRFLIKQGEQAAVASLNLAGFDDALLILSGTPDNADICEEVIAEVGDNPDVWVPLYLQRVRANFGGKQ